MTEPRYRAELEVAVEPQAARLERGPIARLEPAGKAVLRPGEGHEERDALAALPCEVRNAVTDNLAHVVADLDASFERLVRGTKISKGSSETYQFWASDPDGNKFEVMQCTDKSWQLVVHIG